jgi:nucleoside-diphosphate-sugar epimerase
MPARPRLVLVTGGSGFIGRHLVEALLRRGEKVRVLDLLPGSDDRVEFLIGDIRDRDDLMEACAGVDAVFHTAALTTQGASKEEYDAVNIQGTEQVINACIECGVSKLIYTSSASVVWDGSHIRRGDESSLRYPSKYLDDYCASKAVAEQLVIQANGAATCTGVLSTCSLRPHAVFGPRDTHFVPRLIMRARAGLITHLVGNGRNTADFTYVCLAIGCLQPKISSHCRIYFM